MTLDFSKLLKGEASKRYKRYMNAKEEYGSKSDEHLLADLAYYLKNSFDFPEVSQELYTYNSVLAHIILPELVKRFCKKDGFTPIPVNPNQLQCYQCNNCFTRKSVSAGEQPSCGCRNFTAAKEG